MPIELYVADLRARVELLETRLDSLVNTLKVAELTGKGDRYDTKLLSSKEKQGDLGGGAPVEKVKPEHITSEEVKDFTEKAEDYIEKTT
tara:strand:+ start:13668 stop:13934 length:267 start_codon:yes stop_codon:yes gene_type:complete